MGKKTDKFIKDVSDAGSACSTTAEQLLSLLGIWEKVDADWGKYENEMRQLPDWEQHPYAKKRIAIWEKGRRLAAQMLSETNALNMKLGEFKLFVDKKTKKKYIFKSKKSLPMAKEMIASYKDASKDFMQIAKVARSKFY